MTRMRAHDCDCEFCQVSEVEMTPEEIVAEDNRIAAAEEMAAKAWAPARNMSEALNQDCHRATRKLMNRIERSMHGLD
jgi:hypothetical protein